MGLFCIGDIHGDLDKTLELLRGSKIINGDLNWIAGDSTFVFIGDLVDRGPKSIECVQFVMRLQKEAAESGGEVVSVLGNHDLTFLSCLRQIVNYDGFRNIHSLNLFLSNGGKKDEIFAAANHPEIVEWYENCPFLFKKDNILFQHADTTFYSLYGNSLKSINETMREEIKLDHNINIIYNEMCMYRVWGKGFYFTEELLCNAIDNYMIMLGVDTIVHGHTPFVGDKPVYYYDDCIINVDGALSCGYGDNSKCGFVLEL